MEPQVNSLDLTTICGGAAAELFQREFDKVMSNIKDIDTNVKESRKITLTFTFKPYEDQSGAEVAVGVKSALASSPPVFSNVFIRKKGTRYKAFSIDDHPDLFDPITNEGGESETSMKLISGEE